MGELYVRQNMKKSLLILILSSSTTFSEEFRELPENEPIPKVQAWKILDEQWTVIEPLIFTEGGSKYIGRRVRFDSKLIKIANPLLVKTAKGTVAAVTHIPKVDMQLLREFKNPPRSIIVEGTISKIDSKSKIITVKAGGIRPSN